jgi:hypothetical protein
MKRINRLGECKYNSKNELMKIVEYENCDNIIVEFQDDLCLRIHTNYAAFKKGAVCNPRRGKAFQEYQRVGEIGYSKYGTPMKIIKYNSYADIIVEFQDDYRYTTNATYTSFKKSKIRNPYDKEYYGVGFLGRAYCKNEKYVDSLSFKTWSWILQRCYSEIALKRRPTYDGCSVCEDWLEYYNFKLWFDENYYNIPNEVMEIDKDILCKGNKVYSPSTCVFLPHCINSVFCKTDAKRGEFPIGVSYHKRVQKFSSTCVINNKQVHLGYYNTTKEAFYAYKKFKERYIKEIADKYKIYIPKVLYDALYNYKVEITD